jgi:anaerobic magnesium-protoporphyrin IX monomethyl ester cyclase
MERTIKNILLVDLSTYTVNLQDDYLALKTQLQTLQTISWKQRTGFDYCRPGLSYSRGLLLLAACLLRNEYKVRYIVYADKNDRALLPAYIPEVNVVCFMAITPTIKLAASIAFFCKQINPSIKTIVGGPHSTNLPFQTIQEFNAFDYVLAGDGEERLPKLLANIDKPNDVPGIFFRGDGEIYSSGAAIQPVVLSELPIPAYELLSRSLASYAHNIQTSRGCPFECEFCAERQSRGKTSESEHDTNRIIEELSLLKDNLPQNTLIHFSDSVFSLANKQTSKLIHGIRQLKIHEKVIFSCDTRVDVIHESQVRELVQNGFMFFRLGFESVDNHILHLSRKNTISSQQAQASDVIRNVSNHSVILAYLITGLPDTTPDTLAEDINVTYKQSRNGLFDIASDKIMVPYPGTEYFYKPQKYGINITNFDWNSYDRLSFPVYELTTLASKDIYKGFIARETALAKGYLDRMNINNNDIRNVKPLEDYFYLSYLKRND